MVLNKEQLAIVHAKEKKIVVLASAATGKTRVLTERVKYLLEKGVHPQDIAMITFTNAAAYEMRKRIGEKSSLMFVGTVHSLANQFLTNVGIKTDGIIQNEDFDRLFSLVSQNPSCVKSFKYLLLDEAQDSSEIQYEFILNMINPENYLIVGDPKQSIYGFSGARPDILLKIAKESKIYLLNENYRNGYEILEYAKSLISYDFDDYSEAMSEYEGEVESLYLDEEGIANLILYSDTNYKDWFVLTRTNAQLDSIMVQLKKLKIPCDTFRKANLSNGDLIKKMAENTVKVLTVHTSKGLENKNVVVFGVSSYNSDERKVAYVAATRAIKKLYWCKKKKAAKKKKNFVQW